MVKIFIRDLPSPSGLFHLGRDLKKRLIKVMRLRPGDSLSVFSNGRHFECRVERVLPDGIELRVIKELPEAPPASLQITIAQAIPKGDRFEWMIQKATELGAAEIVPLLTARTVVRPGNADSKLQRWNEIAENAAGQSENGYPPIIRTALPLDAYLAQKPGGLKLLLHERQSAEPLKNILAGYSGQPIVIAVGPEGGWTEEETETLLQAQFIKIHLGDRILRAETAGLALLAILQYELGELGSRSPAKDKEDHAAGKTQKSKTV